MKSIRLRDWEVRAIQNGATQIRRLVKVQPPEGAKVEVGIYWPEKIGKHGTTYPGKLSFGAWTDDGEWGQDSPFGFPGDVLIHKATGLEIVTKAVRVERVQEISEADAVACGVVIRPEWAFASNGNPHLRNEARCEYQQQWNKDHGPDSWGRNEYVWVGEFERKAVGNE
jgi:hypothetical protein